VSPDAGRVRRGRTLRIGHLSQNIGELAGPQRVLDVVEEQRRVTRLAGGGEARTSTLLEDFGFTAGKLTTRLDDLSGGERRRLQFLRLLLTEPNVLLLDEPTNDLDIDTLTVIEDYLDRWPGTLIVVTHDRYFLERVTDVTYALVGGGRCVLLPGGVEQYLADRAAADLVPMVAPAGTVDPESPTDAAQARQARKELARLESQLAKLETRVARIHARMAESASDYSALASLQTELDQLLADRDELEAAWLEAAEIAG
jgi:ABC-type multidrug transport system ATPase subunit